MSRTRYTELSKHSLYINVVVFVDSPVEEHAKMQIYFGVRNTMVRSTTIK